MEKEELKRIIKEALGEFFEENFEEWAYWWRKWEKEGYPPSWYFIPVRRKEIISFRESISEFHSATKRLDFLVTKLESWAPQCSERERIETLQKEMNEINERINKILNLLQKEE